MTAGPGRWLRRTIATDEVGRTVEEILRGPMEISGRMIQRLTRSRGISLNRKPARLDRRVRLGDVVAARLATAESSALPPVSMDLSILHEDEDLLVVEKPAGLLVHPTSPKHDRTLVHGLAHHFRSRGVEIRVRPVHRLDRETSGLLLVAKNAFAHQHLDRQIRKGEVTREYLALVEGSPAVDSGVIDLPIGRMAGKPMLRTVRSDGDPAITRYEVLERGATSLLGLRLETGRTHQIRVHMAHLGHPVVGDRTYGTPGSPSLDRLALHAAHIAFRHPRSGERITVSSPLPATIRAAALRNR